MNDILSHLTIVLVAALILIGWMVHCTTRGEK